MCHVFIKYNNNKLTNHNNILYYEPIHLSRFTYFIRVSKELADILYGESEDKANRIQEDLSSPNHLANALSAAREKITSAVEMFWEKQNKLGELAIRLKRPYFKYD